MKIDYLTDADLDRQTCVDNAIYYLIQDLAKDKNIDWDVEDIGEVRDAIENIIVNKLKLMSEFEFYPYIELEEELLAQSELDKLMSQINDNPKPEPKRFTVTGDQLEQAIKKVVEELDYEELAKVAGDFLGGVYVWDKGDDFIFVPDENYAGAFNHIIGEVDDE